MGEQFPPFCMGYVGAFGGPTSSLFPSACSLFSSVLPSCSSCGASHLEQTLSFSNFLSPVPYNSLCHMENVPKSKIPKETNQFATYLKSKVENKSVSSTLAITLKVQLVSQRQSHSMLMSLNCSSLFAPLCQHLLEFQFKLKTKNNRECTIKLTKQNTH